MTAWSPGPYREEDLPARLAALQSEHDEVAAQLEATRAEIASLRPWRWGRFLVGLTLFPVAMLLALLLRAYLL